MAEIPPPTAAVLLASGASFSVNPVPDAAITREDVVVVSVVNEVRVAERSTAVLVRQRRYVDVNQTVRLRRLDGAQGDSVVGCEDGGVYGDPDGQCQYRHGAEAGILRQLAESEFEIVHG